MLNALDAAQQDQIVAAMHAIETLLAGVAETKPGTKPRYILREPRTGDFGWIVSRHAELYAKEYGWTEPFEGLCAQIVADFVNNFDPAGTLLDRRDQRRKCRLRIMLVKDGQPGVAASACWSIRRGAALAWAPGWWTSASARAHRGHKKITLWTHSILAAARRAMRTPVSLSPQASRATPGAKTSSRVLGFGFVTAPTTSAAACARRAEAGSPRNCRGDTGSRAGAPEFRPRRPCRHPASPAGRKCKSHLPRPRWRES